MRYALNGRTITEDRAMTIWQASDTWEHGLFDLAKERSTAGYVAREQIETACDGLTMRHKGEELGS